MEPSNRFEFYNEPVVTATLNTTTTYTVTGTDANGCFSNGLYTVTVNPLPTVNAGPDRNICLGSGLSIPIGTSTAPGTSYSWSPTFGLSCTTCSQTNASPSQSTVYTLTATNLHGCSSQDEVAVNLIPCCTGSLTIPSIGTTTTTYNGGIISSNSSIAINGDLIINGNVTLRAPWIRMAENVKIIINPNSSLTINNINPTSPTRIVACNNMWDGIFLTNSTSILNISGGVNPTQHVWIMDAKNAVVSENGGVFNISNTIFDKNWVGVKVINHPGAHQGSISRTVFNCSSLISKAPHAGSRSWAGIMVEEVGNINVPNGLNLSSKFGIQFLNQEYGIWGQKCVVFSRNNSFNSCGTGIYLFEIVSRDGGTGGLYAGLNTQNSGGNTFTSCIIGIHVHGLNAQIFNNSFTGINKIAIYVSNANYYNHHIKGNMINRCSGIGIYATNNVQFNSFLIEGNTINNSSFVLPVGTGIVLENTGYNVAWPPQNFGQLLVKNNHTSKVETGVLVNRSWSLNLVNNNFNVASKPTGFAYGIRLQDCPSSIITGNSINGTNAQNTQQFGIVVEDSPEAMVVENIVKHVGNHIYWYRHMDGAQLECNSMAFGTHGVVMDAIANPASLIIGRPSTFIPPNTYTLPYASDNVWTTQAPWTSHTFCINNTDGRDIYWYTRYGAPYEPTINDAFSAYPIGLNLNIFMPPNTSCSAPCTTCRNKNLVKIAKNDINYSNMPNENRWLARDYAFKKLRRDDSPMNGNSADAIALQQFYAAEMQSNIGSFVFADEKIADGDIADAQAIINSINPGNPFEANQKAAMHVFLNTHAQGLGLSQSDTILLMPIAMQDALSGGLGVYLARMMLKINTDIIIPVPGSGQRPETGLNVNNTGNSPSEFSVYPNPNNGNMQLQYQLEEGQRGVFALMDLAGKVIKEVKLEDGQRSLSITEDKIVNGIYFYRFMVEGQVVKTGKLVIAK
jgi:hypothetical protein